MIFIYNLGFLKAYIRTYFFSDENGEKTKQHGSSHPDERKVSGGSYKYVDSPIVVFFCERRVGMGFFFLRRRVVK